ncbi:MAG: DUF3795 domain-containing protein [Armatimonadota bacterium]
MQEIIAACGLVCSKCGAYIATKANDAEAIENVAKEWSSQFGADIKPEVVWCDGCMTDGSRKCGHVGECQIRACAIERGLVNCAGCADFGCGKISELLNAAPEACETMEKLRNSNK